LRSGEVDLLNISLLIERDVANWGEFIQVHVAVPVGEVKLDTVFVMVPADYTCEPQGIVTHDEVTQIAKVLRREPKNHAGVVGNYNWREE
jgi:hypothetical protein